MALISIFFEMKNFIFVNTSFKKHYFNQLFLILKFIKKIKFILYIIKKIHKNLCELYVVYYLQSVLTKDLDNFFYLVLVMYYLNLYIPFNFSVQPLFIITNININLVSHSKFTFYKRFTSYPKKHNNWDIFDYTKEKKVTFNCSSNTLYVF